MPTKVLVTGGAGFIGSHTCVELLQHGYEVVVADDLSNSSPRALERAAGIARVGTPELCVIDIRDGAALSQVFADHRIDAVIHFAAKKAVGESVRLPIEYYDTNVGGTTALLSVMREHEVGRLVFSSSCSVYGSTTKVPLTESDPVSPTNPYASSKWMCEQILADTCRRLPSLQVLSLRYFNPVGAHPSGLLGENPHGVPGNLMPYVARVAAGQLERLSIFGDDYPTPDGTGVRDYVHVMDVAEGHRLALEHLQGERGMRTFNLGTGVGSSVLDLVAAFEAASGRRVPYRITGRRPGDVATLVADPTAVSRAWNWTTKRDLAAMCRDAWHFQTRDPARHAC
ncbi:UDP-glucose 4-epimerase GalE [Streptomyces tubbatahanensis]|uniref:UDP-glucose 4-epimerase n=1 Tax=Streptomyces tubbatahanensis TaxID=2923272 RepID=A0ABY3XKT8_9ACTN|nr:UDP-glucose 4-epimerase GalE [Streptomyces tubbatahanensis]UNS95030.1 UDP-glucose 4-epimerase GalE [Streptomyces tubbatahanensis]